MVDQFKNHALDFLRNPIVCVAGIAEKKEL